ncbi:MAG: sigma factor-like helix-turn-helix DNA-binding protein [Candidatus Woesearchaeota archaeon]
MITKKEIEIIKLRYTEGLTQVDVAKRLNISQAAVSKFEKSAKQKIKNSYKIIEFAEKLGIKQEEDDL